MRSGTGGFPRWSRPSTRSGSSRAIISSRVLQNRWEAATLHWACQFAGVIVTPLNWRSTADELDFCLENAEAKAIVYEDVSAEAVRASAEAGKRAAHRRRRLRRRDRVRDADRSGRAGRAAARRCRGVVGDALYVRHDRAGRRACRAASAPSAPRRSRMSRRISIARASARSASCRSITPWACARCWRCR